MEIILKPFDIFYILLWCSLRICSSSDSFALPNSVIFIFYLLLFIYFELLKKLITIYESSEALNLSKHNKHHNQKNKAEVNVHCETPNDIVLLGQSMRVTVLQKGKGFRQEEDAEEKGC